jgi:hypothetical protein
MEFQKVLPSDSSIVMFAKIAVNQGRSPGLEKDAFYDAIMKRANDLRADGESQQQAFAKTITDDPTGQLLYQAMKIAPGSEVKAAPAPSYDPLAKAAELAEIRGPAHAKIHSLAIDHQRAHPGMSYQSAYGYLYAKPENAALRNAIKAEHMSATMSAHDGGELGKAAPMDAVQDDVGTANQEMHELVITRMKREPNLTYERAFVREYTHPANRSLKQRYDAESDAHMRRLSPAVKPFPAYGNPGDIAGGGRVGHTVGGEGPRPKGYAGG